MKKITVLILLILLTNVSHAQFNETIRTGRPGQAIGPFAVGKHVFQTQTGFDVGGFDEDQFDRKGNYSALNTILRFGITRHFEINSAWEYRGDEEETSVLTSSANGVSTATIGTRINLYEGDGFPALGIQVTFKLPILSEEYNPEYLAPQILLIASQSISDKVSFLLNTGVDYNGDNAEPTGIYVANLSYSISDKWGTFIENYGDFNGSSFNNRWDTGLSYLMNNNIQFDIYGGIGENEGVFDYFTSIGISYRTLALRK